MLRKILMCLSASALLSCGALEQNDSTTKIIDGVKIPVSTTKKSFFSASVGLLGGADANLCSGTRVSQFQILTAAHCSYKTGENIYVMLSNAMIVSMKVFKAIPHPEYDAATIKLGETDLLLLNVVPSNTEDGNKFITFSDVAVIDYSPLSLGQQAYVVGAGCEDQLPCKTHAFGNQMKYAKTEITSLNLSLFPNFTNYFQLDSFLFAEGDEGTIYSGDSGGGVYNTRGQLIGVTSSGGGTVDSNHVRLENESAVKFLQANLKK